MHRSHTTKLFYKSYTHNITFSSDMAGEILTWAAAEMPKLYRRYGKKRRDKTLRYLSIYCKRSEFDRLLARWGDQITSVTCPIDDDAEALLVDGTKIDIREKPYWNRFRYAIRFWIRDAEVKDLYGFITSRLGKGKGEYKIIRSRHFPNLYLRDESQLTMIKLSEPPAKIIETIKVYTHKEVQQAIR